MEKTCTNCGESKALAEFFKDRSKKDGYRSWCKTCDALHCKTDRSKLCQKNFRKRHLGQKRNYNRWYYSTSHGHLVKLYHHINLRCKKRKFYLDKGVTNKFVSSEVFVNYVLDELKVDPLGKECHRINDDGHYEPGNIEFLTRAGHKEAHREMRAGVLHVE